MSGQHADVHSKLLGTGIVKNIKEINICFYLGTSRLFASKTSTAKSSAYGIGAAKSKLAMNKRKSKTPNKARLLRRSRQLEAARAAAALAQDTDATVLSSDSTAKTTSLMSTIMSSTNASSCSTNASSTNGSKLKSNHLSVANGVKGPPLSNSSKFALNYKSSVANASKAAPSDIGNRFGFKNQMTSTAQNTFIEEEDLENLENYPSDSLLSVNKNNSLLHAVSAKLSGGGGFQFQAPTSINKFHAGETDYANFAVSILI